MLKGKQKITACYQPHSELRDLMIGLLFYHDQDELEVVSDGFSEREKEQRRKHKRSLDKKKVGVLDNFIFPSMANLVFFFKCLETYPELRKQFENDIKDLLGVRRNNAQPYGFVILNLLQAVLLVREGFYSENRKFNKDFRLRLNQIIQEIVSNKVDLSLTKVFNNESAQSAVSDDFKRVRGWTRMLAESSDNIEDKIPPSRTIDFRTDHLKPDIIREEQEEC